MFPQMDLLKPKMRGVLHAVMSPITLIAGIVLIVLSPTTSTKVGSSVFIGTGLLLFTVSAIYHRGKWSPPVWAWLRRFDHSNIYLLIAGSYTPFTLMLVPGSRKWLLLGIVWTGAILGVIFRMVWTDAPRWLYTPIYVLLGWAAIFFAKDFANNAPPAVLTLMVAGGVLYSLGGLVYGIKRPDPWPQWFGFHEIFHTLTIVAFGCHYVAASIATYHLR